VQYLPNLESCSVTTNSNRLLVTIVPFFFLSRLYVAHVSQSIESNPDFSSGETCNRVRVLLGTLETHYWKNRLRRVLPLTPRAKARALCNDGLSRELFSAKSSTR
jgi:hypothetical protein